VGERMIKIFPPNVETKRLSITDGGPRVTKSSANPVRSSHALLVENIGPRPDAAQEGDNDT